jgi:hypothetical protein
VVVIRRSRPWLAARRLAIATGLLAAVPEIVSVIGAIARGWLPYDDRGLGAVRAYDVLSSHPPLVGTHAVYSLASRPSYSPGPLHYWLLALPARLGPVALLLTVGLVNVVSVVAVVVLAERRAGRGFMLVTAVAVALMSGSLPPESLHDMWEPYLTLLPFTLLIFLCWSVACGEYRLLAVTVLVASFVVQCHVAYAPAAAGLVAISAVGLLHARRRGRLPPLRRALAAAAIVGLVCWCAPLIDQAIHRPGNLVNLGWYAVHRGATVGADPGWRAVERVVGVPPWWLRSQLGPSRHIADLLHAPAPLAVASSIAILLALAVVLASTVRTRDFEVGYAAAIALLLCGSVALVTAATPQRNGLVLTLSYTIDWGSAVGMWVWLTLVLALQRLAPPVLARSRPLATPVGVVVVAAAAAAVAARISPDPAAPDFHAMNAVARRVETSVRGARVVRVDYAPTFMGYEFAMGVVYALRRNGVEPLVPSLAVDLGGWYARRHVRPDRFVLVRETAHRAAADAPGATRVTVKGDPLAVGGAGTVRDVVVTVAPAP